jgi:hypothetical protein
MKKLFQALFVACLYSVGNTVFAGFYITLDRSNPAPLTTTEMPNIYNYTRAKEKLSKGQYDSGSGISVIAMPYYSRANIGTNLYNDKGSEIGDLAGRWNLFAIMDTNLPNNYNPGSDIPALLGSSDNPSTASSGGTIPSDLIYSLTFTGDYDLTPFAGTSFYGGTSYTTSGSLPSSLSAPTEFQSIPGLLSLQDAQELVGYLTIPTKYSRYGSRFEISGSTNIGVGALVQFGVASVSQRAIYDNEIKFGNVDVTTTTSGTTTVTTNTNAAYYVRNGVKILVNNPFYNDAAVGKVTDQQWYASLKNIKRNTTNKLNEIAETIGLNLNDYQRTGLEDLRGEIYWRKALRLKTAEPILFIPFVSFVGTLDLSEAVDPNQPLALPFGNNGHKSYGANAGFTLDFSDSFEIGTAVGVVSFSDRYEPNLRVPNQEQQSGIYPYATAAKINPGNSWFASLLMNCHHFEEDLSFFMQYLYVGHSRDKIILTNPDPAYLPKVLEGKTIWNSHLANVGLNYEVSPSVMIGCAGQIPLKQMNAYRVASFAVSIIASH